MAACARARLSNRPRSTRSTSARLREVGSFSLFVKALTRFVRAAIVASDYARRESLAVPGRAVEFARAKLGDHSGVVGAALIGAGA